jgi:hypothetical protein
VSAAVLVDRRGGRKEFHGAFLESLSSVADAERKGLALAGQDTADRLSILTDPQAALRTVANLSNGTPPRSGIEIELKAALSKRRDQETAVACIHSHVGFPGNEEETQEPPLSRT